MTLQYWTHFKVRSKAYTWSVYIDLEHNFFMCFIPMIICYKLLWKYKDFIHLDTTEMSEFPD